jgi:hypothetical protein
MDQNTLDNSATIPCAIDNTIVGFIVSIGGMEESLFNDDVVFGLQQ